MEWAPPIGSAIEHVSWPAIPSAPAAGALALLYRLERSQWWPAEALPASQLRQLGAVVDHALRTCPFYRRTYRKAKIRIDGPLTDELWQRLPVLSRQDLLTHYKDICSRTPPVGHDVTDEALTSGSTGRPVRVRKTVATGAIFQALVLREHGWYRRDLGKTMAVIAPPLGTPAPYPDGVQTLHWDRETASVFQTGPGARLDLETPVEEQIEWLLRVQPAYLATFSTNLRALAEHALRHGIKLPGLVQVIGYAEALREDTRELCRQAWNVDVIERYSTDEFGQLGIQCPEHGNLHACAESVLLEVVDEDNRPCAPGQMGRVLVSSLWNFATPLLRYELGDLAELGPPCGCGRGLPVIASIRGRTRDMVRLPDGRTHLPYFSGLLVGIDAVRQFQVRHVAGDRLEVHLVAGRPLNGAEAAELTRRLQDRLRYPFEVTLIYVDGIARTPGGKYMDFVSDIGPSERMRGDA